MADGQHFQALPPLSGPHLYDPRFQLNAVIQIRINAGKLQITVRAETLGPEVAGKLLCGHPRYRQALHTLIHRYIHPRKPDRRSI